MTAEGLKTLYEAELRHELGNPGLGSEDGKACRSCSLRRGACTQASCASRTTQAFGCGATFVGPEADPPRPR